MKRNILFLIISIFVFYSGQGFSVQQTTSETTNSKKSNLKKASYWSSLDGSTIQCALCPRKCVIQKDGRGFCGVRTNKNGTLYTLGYSNPIAVAIDPIEKKPFFHVTPGEPAFSLAVAGCNMRCVFCQNWQISQAKPDETPSYNMQPIDVVNAAIKNNCKWIVYTYTEPTVFYEYMLDIAKLAKQKGLYNAMHSCGYINKEPLENLLPYMDAVNIDLKGFTEDFYAKMGSFSELAPVLNTLKLIKQKGVWLEITNLVIPTANDDMQKIKEMCVWIKQNLGDDVPLHFSRFHPDFKLKNLPETPIETLELAHKIAKDAGVKYVYIGNVPGHKYENTFCPRCGKLIVGRTGYSITEINIKDGKCKYCGYKISGVWKYKK
jgi:pyruvate formate lyase activating enzyme